MALYSLTRTVEPYPVRRLEAREIQDALGLMRRVYLQYEAPEYTQEGVDFFKAAWMMSSATANSVSMAPLTATGLLARSA